MVSAREVTTLPEKEQRTQKYFVISSEKILIYFLFTISLRCLLVLVAAISCHRTAVTEVAMLGDVFLQVYSCSRHISHSKAPQTKA